MSATPHSLDDLRAKIKRADEHIRQISDDVTINHKITIPTNAVRANMQLEVHRLDDPSTHRRRIVFYLKGLVPPLDVSFTILAGEAIHQLRSVLDHIVYQLVIARTKLPPDV